MGQDAEIARIEDLLVHADWLRRLAATLVHERDAEDLVQETWAAAMHAPPATDQPVEPWLATVLRNLVRKRWRREHVQARNQRDLQGVAGSTASPQELLERAQLQRKLAEAVVELEEPYRTAILWRYYEGRSAADIARTLGLPAGTVRWRLSEGMQRLRQRLDEQHLGGRRAWVALLAPWSMPAAPGGSGAPAAAPPPFTEGGLLMALGTKGKLGLGALVVLLLAVGLSLQLWGPASRHTEAPPPPSPALARTGLPLLMPAGTVSTQSGTIEGVVRDPDGRAVEGAVVALASGPSGRALIGPRKPAGTASSDGQGRFRLAGLAAGEYRLTATAGGFAPALSAPFVLGPNEGRHLELTLAAGGHTLQGRVLDDGGGPIPGARVVAWAGSGGTAMPSGPATLFQVTADDQGRYQIALAPREYTIRGEAGGYAPAETTVPVTRDLRRDLRLQPAGRVAGVVLERGSRQPLADAVVTLMPTAMMGGATSREVRTDAQGAFQIDDAETGNFQVNARLGPAWTSGPLIAVIPTQLIQGVEVLLDSAQRGVSIAGQVVDASGKGVAGARIVAGGVAVADADGRFQLAGVAPGPVRVTASAPSAELGDAEQPVVVPVEGVRDLRITIAPRPGLTGRVLDAAGVPVPGASVRIEPLGRDARGALVETAADGSYRMTGLPEGRLALVAWHTTLGVARQELEPLAAGTRLPVDLRLQPGASIAGTVRFTDGRPAAGVSVAFTGQQRGSLYASVATGDDGQYRSSGLLPGKYTVRARRKAGPWNISTSRERPDLRIVTIGEGEQARGVDLELAPGGQVISGRVFAPDGSPAAGATVVANIEENGKSWKPRASQAEHLTISREDGAFTLDDVESGSFQLWANRPGWPEATVTNIAAGRKDVRIELRGGSSLGGVVVDGGGQPVPRFTLNVLPVEDGTPETRTVRMQAAMSSRPVDDPGGAFRWDGLAAGNYEIQVQAASGAVAKQTVALGGGEAKAGLRLTLAAGARVTGKVVALESGQPLAGVRIYARLAARHTEVMTGADGAFALAGVLPGEEFEISAMAGEELIAERKQVTVPAGAASVDAGLFRLMKRLPGKTTREDGTLRMALDSRDDKVAVRMVRPGSPAERAGIKAGDLILSVDGKDVSGLGASAINHHLERKPGAPVTLVVQSPGGPPRTVTATMEAYAQPVAAKP